MRLLFLKQIKLQIKNGLSGKITIEGGVQMAEKEKGRDRIDASAFWMAWVGIAAGIIAFFFAPLFFGCVAVVLGLIAVFSKANNLGW